MVGALPAARALALSNFLPLLGGVNVMLDHFPANPTTWYLGTYLHLLLLWAVWLRRIRIRAWMVAAAVAIEIPVRAALIAIAGPFVAYMLLTNWIGVFLFGIARADRAPQRSRNDVATGGGARRRARRLVGARRLRSASTRRSRS